MSNENEDTAAKRVVRKNEKFNIPDQTEQEEAETHENASVENLADNKEIKRRKPSQITKENNERLSSKNERQRIVEWRRSKVLELSSQAFRRYESLNHSCGSPLILNAAKLGLFIFFGLMTTRFMCQDRRH